ncbi:MAG: hypothetical protein ACJ8BW_14065 [Ktedonobacteraceae bacterium]
MGFIPPSYRQCDLYNKPLMSNAVLLTLGEQWYYRNAQRQQSRGRTTNLIYPFTSRQVILQMDRSATNRGRGIRICLFG